MTLKKDLNFEEKLTFENFDYLKNDIRNLVKFKAVESLKIFTLMAAFVESI